jgi:hypothetical protein
VDVVTTMKTTGNRVPPDCAARLLAGGEEVLGKKLTVRY